MHVKKWQIGVLAAVLVVVVAAVIALSGRFFGIAYVSTEVPGTFSVGGIRYAVIEGSGSQPAVQVGSGTQPEASGLGDALASSSPNVTIPASVDYEGVTYQVTEIAPYAFQNLEITSVSLPEGLTKIGKGAFQLCRQLGGVSVPSTVKMINGLAFFADNSLASVEFAPGSELAEIGDGAFAIMKTSGSMDNSDLRASLGSISLPASLNILGSYAFYGQTALASVTFEGDTLNEVSPYAFGQCTSLASIELPTFTSTIERIGRFAFEGDTALTTVVFNGGVTGTQTTQAGNEFAGCTNITTVIYRDKKWNASNAGANTPPAYLQGATTSASSGTTNLTGVNTNLTSSFSFGTSGFSDAADLHEYYTVAQYASREDAEAGINRTGEALVLAGTLLADVNSGAYEPFESDEGFTTGAWAFEAGSAVCDGISDSLYAYPADEHDLGAAGLVVEGAYNDDGLPTVEVSTGYAYVPVRLWNAAGVELAEKTDFTLTCVNAEGEACDVAAISQPGTYVLTAEGAGEYVGSVSTSFEVVDVSASWTRISADDAVSASQLVARAGFANASSAEVPCEWAVVCSASADHAADALAAAALAGALGAPVLLNGEEGLSTEVSYEINRVGARNVVVVGNADAVSQEAYAAAEALYTVDKVYRIDGADATELAANVSQLAGQLGVSWSDTCVLVGVDDLVSAWSASSYAYASGAPVLFTDASALSEVSAGAIIAGGFSRVIVVGSENSVSAAVSSTLASSGFEVERISGADDAEVNAAFAAFALDEGMGVDGAGIASADALAQGLCASALCGRANAVVLLAENATSVLGPRIGEVAHGYVLGSVEAVSEEALAQVEAL